MEVRFIEGVKEESTEKFRTVAMIKFMRRSSTAEQALRACSAVSFSDEH